MIASKGQAKMPRRAKQQTQIDNDHEQDLKDENNKDKNNNDII